MLDLRQVSVQKTSENRPQETHRAVDAGGTYSNHSWMTSSVCGRPATSFAAEGKVVRDVFGNALRDPALSEGNTVAHEKAKYVWMWNWITRFGDKPDLTAGSCPTPQRGLFPIETQNAD